jgi:GNAT superfamily N-acetyltransferase
MTRFRRLDWLRDAPDCRRLDVSFATETVFDVEAGPMRFDLVERPIDPVRSKRYDVDWSGVVDADRAVVAEDGGRVVGVIAARRSAWNRRAVISHLYVDAAARRRGIGAGLIAAIEEWARTTSGARSLWIETQNVNPGAIRFYQRLGFVCCGLDTSLYDPDVCPGETAVFFSLPLDGRAGTAINARTAP